MPRINGKEVGPIGYGLMGLTWRANPCSDEQAFAAMREAIAQGCTYWAGADFYGPPDRNSLALLARYFTKYPEDADKVLTGIKGASSTTTGPDSSPDALRGSIDAMLAHLQGTTGTIGLFGPGRRDKKVPQEQTLAIINEYVAKGQVGGIFLSEVAAETIHEAAKITRISAVEVELSLWSTDVLTNGVAAACAEHDIPLVAYSPLGRGILTGQITKFEDIPEGDIRLKMPRFQPDVFGHNLKLVEQLKVLADKKGCTTGQLAIGWIKGISRRPGMPTIIPIPGATTAERVRENGQLVELSDEEMAWIDETLSKFEVKGSRYYAGAFIET
jgi:pyridoxine 4-dehydrogenase